MRLRCWKQKMIVSSPAVTQHRQPHPWRQPGHPLRPRAPPHPPHVSPWGCPSITSTSPTPSCQVSSASLLVSAARRSEVSLCSSIAPSSLFWAVNAVGGWITGKKETKRIFTVKTKHTICFLILKGTSFRKVVFIIKVVFILLIWEVSVGVVCLVMLKDIVYSLQ